AGDFWPSFFFLCRLTFTVASVVGVQFFRRHAVVLAAAHKSHSSVFVVPRFGQTDRPGQPPLQRATAVPTSPSATAGRDTLASVARGLSRGRRTSPSASSAGGRTMPATAHP